MTVQQLEYIIAVDNYRHFANAAEACYVTQPTLSTMIQKLEDELGVKIFDRLVQPVEPTQIGKKILRQARITVKHFDHIQEVVDNEKDVITGEFKIGIVPTIAAYLVPELLRRVKESETGINVSIQETTTIRIIERLLTGQLDGGLLITPLNEPMLKEIPLYYEKFYAYVSPQEPAYEMEEIDMQEIDIRRVWLLDEIHCMRGQVLNLCKRKKEIGDHQVVQYESGSLDTLISIVDYNGGLTVIPEMMAMGLSEDRQENLRNIKGQIGVREVSLVIHRDFVKQKMLNAMKEIIQIAVPKSMQDFSLKEHMVELDRKLIYEK